MNQDIFVLIEHLQGEVTEISYVMLAAGNSITQQVDGRVVAVLLGHNAQILASELAADEVIYADHASLVDFNPYNYQRVVSELLTGLNYSPRLWLFGDTSIGVEVAGPLSTHLNMPLISNCLGLQAENSQVKFVCQAFGGKIMAEGLLPASTCLVTMIPGGYKPEQGRTGKHQQSDQRPSIVSLDTEMLRSILADPSPVHLKQYILPDDSDVDISRQTSLVSIGRGIQTQDNIELAQELADVLGGALCSSRPVIDQGWLPATRLVGKSGKRVKPNLYLALGISGAPEHVEAITDSQVIIAINSDPSAPIFLVADYGVVMDMFELVPQLIEKIRLGKAVQIS